jgi:DNA-binding response OmpR family regulator
VLIPVLYLILISGDDTASADFIQAGANDSLLKPVGRDELLTALSAHLSSATDPTGMG